MPKNTENMFALTGGRVIDVQNNRVIDATVVASPAGIRAVAQPDEAAAMIDDQTEVIDVAGRLVAPGLIDVHGDAFERSIMPRGGVFVPFEIALADNRSQLLAAGITTSFLSATDSWEPGLRSRQTLRDLVAALDADTSAGPNVLLHVRHETTNTDDFEELAEWVTSGVVSMLSVADHTPGGMAGAGAEPSRTQLQRTGLGAEEMRHQIAQAVERRSLGTNHDEALVSLARTAACATASHDGGNLDHVAHDEKLGVEIAEFPKSVDVAAAYRSAGMRVLFGAPNLVRGGSHLGNLSVADVLDASAGDVLCSDYHYPSLLQAPFVAARDGLCDLGEAWRTVSLHPAQAAGLVDRGALGAGLRADIVVLDDSQPDAVAVAMAWVDGQRVLHRT